MGLGLIILVIVKCVEEVGQTTSSTQLPITNISKLLASTDVNGIADNFVLTTMANLQRICHFFNGQLPARAVSL